MVNLFEELVAVIKELDSDRVPFALCGGLAVAVHGHPRATKDIDLLLPEDQVERAKTAVKRAGFGLPALPMRFNVGTRKECVVHRIPKIVDGNPLTVDLIVAGENLRSVFDSREAFEWNRCRIVVVSRGGLGLMKRNAGRPQDLFDLERLGLPEEDDG